MSFIERHMTTACWVTNRVEAAEPDTHGNPVYVDSEPIPTMCFVAPRVAPESIDGRAAESGWTVYLGPQMAGRINAFSFIEVEGYGRLEVEGEPAVHLSLTTNWPHHVEATCRRSTA